MKKLFLINLIAVVVIFIILPKPTPVFVALVGFCATFLVWYAVVNLVMRNR